MFFSLYEGVTGRKLGTSRSTQFSTFEMGLKLQITWPCYSCIYLHVGDGEKCWSMLHDVSIGDTYPKSVVGYLAVHARGFQPHKSGM